MAAKLINGNELSAGIREELKAKVIKMQGETGIVPGLAVVLVGDDPASASYVRGKGKACEEVGILEETTHMPADISEDELLEFISTVNRDPRFHGILVQLPLPKHISEPHIIEAIPPAKDVDGLHPVNMGKLLLGTPVLIPCTPLAVQQMLVRSGYSPEGKHVVIVGRGNIVGKPLSALLMQKAPGANATVTVVHTGTRDMTQFTRQADILVAATGRAGLIAADMVKEGVVIIDVSINRVEDPTARRGYRLAGDVDFDAVKEKAEAITPVPGGVGPMTVTMLLANTIQATQATLK